MLVLVVGSPSESLFMGGAGTQQRGRAGGGLRGKSVTSLLLVDFGVIWARKPGHLEFRSRGKWGRSRKMNTRSSGTQKNGAERSLDLGTRVWQGGRQQG